MGLARRARRDVGPRFGRSFPFAGNLSGPRRLAIPFARTMVGDGTIETDPEPGEQLPEKVHDYRILGRLGRGGFADVYLACQKGSFRLVALKVLREPGDDRVREQVLSRFHTEESIARAIDHPAIVQIRASSPAGVTPAFIAMEYVEGLPFCEHFRRHPEVAELADVARVAHQVAAAMAAAHRLGIVHRDLKPDNVLVTRGSLAEGGGRPKILDFGIAKAPLALFAGAHERAITRYVTELGTVMGSPPYMAPEQNGAAHAVTGKADVFALGVMLLLVACRAEEGDLLGPRHLLLQPEHVTEVLGRRPDLPAPWVALLTELLAFDPARRPEMSEVARRLQRLAQRHEPFAAAVEGWLSRGEVPSRRQLRPLLRWAETAGELTADEQRFLRRATAAHLSRPRWPIPAAAAGLAALGVGVLAARQPVVVTAPPAPESEASVAAVAAAAPEVAGSTAPPTPSVSPVECVEEPAPAAAVAAAAALRELDECRRALRLARGERDAAATELEASRATVAELEVNAAAAELRLTGFERDLALARESAAEQGKQAFVCRQELEGRTRELDETTERWRVCARGTRGGATPASVSQPPSTELPTELREPAATPPAADPPPPES